MSQKHHVGACVGLLTALVLQGFLLTYFFFLEPDWGHPFIVHGASDSEQSAMSAVLPGRLADSRTSWEQSPQATPDRLELAEAINASGQCLRGLCKDSGQFVYKFNLDAKIEHKPAYNVLRHAGTIYSLAQYHQWHPNSETWDTLVRSATFLKDNTVAPVSQNRELLAVWSSPELNHGDDPIEAKLGGAGLALVALCSLEKIHPNQTSVEYLRQIGCFVLYMQKSDGSFYSKYIPSQEGRSDAWTSLYYPGEAILGLLMLNEIDPNPKWRQAAAEGMAYLARIRADRRKVEADHWALLATAKLLDVYDSCEQPIPRQAVVDHAAKICNSILSEQVPFAHSGAVRGAFTIDGRTCPTATRLEGLHAALTFLPETEQQLRSRIRASVGPGIGFLLRSQVRSGEFQGAIPRAISRLSKGNSAALRTFNRRATEVRIDYVQHALSAMIAHSELVSQQNAQKLAEIQ